uniref:Uncharacterized protein n=1 Tax=Arundo donax TaxID=35708 RepID=A0A0A8ZIE2_ARUDO
MSLLIRICTFVKKIPNSSYFSLPDSSSQRCHTRIIACR